MRKVCCQFSVLMVVAMTVHASATADEIWPNGLQRERQQAAKPLPVVDDTHHSADIVLLTDSELPRNAADWIADFAQRTTGKALKIGGIELLTPGVSHIVAAVGNDSPLVKRLTAAGTLQLQPLVGEQGFVIQRVSDPQSGELLICWSPDPLGCRYGLIEILRSFTAKGKSVETPLGRVVDRPQFPMRIYYLNFAEHLQNAYNPNVLFDSPVNRWTLEEWERLIDMASAFRYNIFEFWLVPTLFSPEALNGGKIQTEFAATMNHVIAYGKRRGVAVLPIQAVNTVGENWHYHCPNDPKERAEIIALWDHWSKALKGNDYIGLFPGDPGGCVRNGCTAETYVDLCIELSKVIRKNNPTVTFEVNTWGEPFGGWGVPLWSGNRQRAEQSMKYFLAKLPELPPGTITSINQGFSGDCDPNTGGGDGRPFAKEAAKTRPVLTWDYSVTEGEYTVTPRCRIRRMFQQRQAEMTLGCYSGGICYTMTPKLNCVSAFGCAEAYWNPNQKPEDVLAEFGRLTFGEDLAAIGPLLEEYEVVPDWGYYAPFPYTPQRLRESMTKLLPLLKSVKPEAKARLPLVATMAEYRASLIFFADLFQKLGSIAADLEEASTLAKKVDKVAANREGLLSLSELEVIVEQSGTSDEAIALRDAVKRLRSYDLAALRKSYGDTVYGIYDAGIPMPADPRSSDAIGRMFDRFYFNQLRPVAATSFRLGLKSANTPLLAVALGDPAGERGWTLSGWTAQGEYQGETWRASFEQPGILTRDDFEDKGYQWLTVRMADGPAGSRKSISINGQEIGQFLRTGPSLDVKKEWWVTRNYPIPKGLLKDGHIEIRFTEPGIAVSDVVLAVERRPDN